MMGGMSLALILTVTVATGLQGVVSSRLGKSAQQALLDADQVERHQDTAKINSASPDVLTVYKAHRANQPETAARAADAAEEKAITAYENLRAKIRDLAEAEAKAENDKAGLRRAAGKRRVSPVNIEDDLAISTLVRLEATLAENSAMVSLQAALAESRTSRLDFEAKALVALNLICEATAKNQKAELSYTATDGMVPFEDLATASANLEALLTDRTSVQARGILCKRLLWPLPPLSAETVMDAEPQPKKHMAATASQHQAKEGAEDITDFSPWSESEDEAYEAEDEATSRSASRTSSYKEEDTPISGSSTVLAGDYYA